MMKNNIALIYMGGTFGCVGDPLAPMSAELFLPKLEHLLHQDYAVQCYRAPVIKDSSACTAADWLQLVQFIQELQLQEIRYFIIIHGTDTLSYASAVLAHCLAQSAHVILTGSQYPLLNVRGDAIREFSDALDNLRFALESVLQSPPGVYLAFHQQLLHAQTAFKQHTTELNAFAGLKSHIPLQPSQQVYRVTLQDIEKAVGFNCMSIMMQPIDLSQQLANLHNLLQRPPHFLFLQGFGTGNLAVNQALVVLIDQLYAQGCISVLTTQVPFGATDQRYAIAEWVHECQILLNDSYGHADLYAKALKMYLQYETVEQWHRHWYD